MASNFSRATADTQIAYLSDCLSTDLVAKLDFGACETIDAALALVEADYKLRNPLTVRRLQFYRCRQEKHEAFTDYIVRLKAASKEADVPIMTRGDIMALQMLGGCNDSELLKKLLDVEPCEAAHLKQCAVTYETHKHIAGEIKGGLFQQEEVCRYYVLQVQQARPRFQKVYNGQKQTEM